MNPKEQNIINTLNLLVLLFRVRKQAIPKLTDEQQHTLKVTKEHLATAGIAIPVFINTLKTLDDKGYLRSIYKYGEQIGVGIGGPDLMVTRKGQLNHLITLLHEERYTVPIGIAIQDGNYVGKTGNESTNVTAKNRKNIVPLLHGFAKDFLKVNYMFWTNQAPYFKQDVLPCFSKVGN